MIALLIAVFFGRALQLRVPPYYWYLSSQLAMTRDLSVLQRKKPALLSLTSIMTFSEEEVN